LKHEIRREPVSIAFDRFVKAERRDAVDFCEIAIQHDAGASDCPDHSLNLLDWNE
jgi:hypothetical protein